MKYGSRGASAVLSKSSKHSKYVNKKHPQHNRTKSFPADPWFMKGTGQSIATFQGHELQTTEEVVNSEMGYELLCTYNWAPTKEPAIYVPGAPARWAPKDLPITLPRDKGKFFIDHNACKAPKYPFEPMFQAIRTLNKPINFADVDVVTNRNSLRKLLKFAAGRVNESFRIDLYTVQNTLFLTRRERNNHGWQSGSRNSGFGHTFEHTFTTPKPGLENSTSHHRVIRYSLGNMDCVVRFEVDACLPHEGPLLHEDDKVPTLLPNHDNLLPDLKRLSLKEASERMPTRSKSAPTRVIPRGNIDPSCITAEIKSRSKGVQLYKAMPQLWFGRTPNLITGLHINGTFDKVKHMKIEFQTWEDKNQDALRRLPDLLSCLRQATLNLGHGCCIAVYNHKIKPPRLELFASSKNNAVLPSDIIEEYWGRDSDSLFDR